MRLLLNQLFLNYPVSAIVELWSSYDPKHRSREMERSEMVSMFRVSLHNRLMRFQFRTHGWSWRGNSEQSVYSAVPLNTIIWRSLAQNYI